MDWSSLVMGRENVDWGAFALVVGINLLITAIAYLFVPVLLSLLGKKYDAKKLKRINFINSTIVWLTFRIIEISLTDDPSTGAAVFLWGAIGYAILKKHCLAPKQPSSTSVPPSPTQSYTPHVQLSAKDETSPVNRSRFDVYGSDIKLEQTAETPKVPTQPPVAQQTPSYVPNTKPTTKYCSHCGHAIDPVTKKCSGCEKQYFKGFNTKTILIIMLSILLVVSIVGCILLYASNIKLKENADALNTSNVSQKATVTVPNTKNETSRQSSTTNVLKKGQIGVFVYTIDHEFTAGYVHARCENSIIDAKELGINPEMIIYDIMDYHGGEYHIIEAGDFVDEIDSWCFSSERKVGDLAMIENPYGYSVCYISCIGER